MAPPGLAALTDSSTGEPDRVVLRRLELERPMQGGDGVIGKVVARDGHGCFRRISRLHVEATFSPSPDRKEVAELESA